MSSAIDRALQACAEERIHLSGAIQPHGYLISCALPDWTIRHVSMNVEAITGAPAEEMLRHSLREFFTDDLILQISETIGFSEPGAPPQRAAMGNLGPLAQLCDISAHAADGLVHIEIEVQPNDIASERSPTLVAQNMIARLAGDEDSEDFHQHVAEQVRLLTGYDRVLVYRFRHDDAGEVISESRNSEMPSYLGLRYPGSDIPPQARTLYLRNRVRVIPDADYVPVPIVPDRLPDGQPLDLSQHALRSVSPVHMQYLRNMGVAASASISIVSGGRLWGLIACHHLRPRTLSPGIRAAADMFGLFVSMRVAAREQRLAIEHEDGARAIRDALALRLDAASDPHLALGVELDLLYKGLPADGVALVQDDRWLTAGRTPAAEALPGLRAWLGLQSNAGIHSTARRDDWAGSAQIGDGLAGVLAMPLDSGAGEWLFFFRREQIEEVRWAGRPDAPFEVDPDGRHIGPRKSFASWHETVRGRSVPWSDADHRVAERLSILLRERYRRSHHRLELGDLRAYRTRMEMRDQRLRLVQLSELLDGLLHVGPDKTARLAERIGHLEAELQTLIRDEEPSNAPDE